MSAPVVVTGAGLICPLADSPGSLHEALLAGRHAFHAPTAFAAEEVGGRVVTDLPDFDPARYLGPRNLRPLDRTGRLAAVAAANALATSGWTARRTDDDELGLVLGTAFGSLKTIAEFDRRALRDGPEYVSPLDFANTVINAAAGQVAIWHQLRGGNTTIAAGAAAGLHAIGHAAAAIRAGRAEVLLAGGAEEVCYETFLGFLRAGLLADAPGDAPGPCPFGTTREGWVLGEGAAFLVLETADRARARGARVLGAIEGFGAAFEPRARERQWPEAGGLEAAIDEALAEAGIGAGDLAFASAAASGHPWLDRLEAGALAYLDRRRGACTPVTAVKARLGETLGAGGALQAVAALEAQRTRVLPGIPASARAAEAAALDVVTGTVPRPIAGAHALIIALAPEGTCCALVLSGAPESMP